MSQVIDLEASRLEMAVKAGYRNWSSQFKEHFDLGTRASHISIETLSFLAQGNEEGTFYIYDLIMNLKKMGSGFEFNELSKEKKMIVIDRYLFLLDHIRFECMRRLGWLESYPGDEFTLVELVMQFDKLSPNFRAQAPVLSPDHPAYKRYSALDTFDKEVFVRKLIPNVLEELGNYSTTL